MNDVKNGHVASSITQFLVDEFESQNSYLGLTRMEPTEEHAEISP